MTRSWSLLCALLLVSAVPHAFAQDPRQEASVMQVEFSPDGTRLVACYFLHATNRSGTNWSCWGGAWDLKTGKGIFIPNVIVPLAFAPDGETVALGQPALRTRHPTITEVRLGLWKFGESKPQRIFDPNDIPPETPKVPGDSLSHKQAVPPPQTKEIVIAAAFHPTGKQIATVSAQGQVVLWPLGEDEKPREIVNLKEQLRNNGWEWDPYPNRLFFVDDAKFVTFAAVNPSHKRPGSNQATTWRIELAAKEIQRTDAKPEPQPPLRPKERSWLSADGKRLAKNDEAAIIRVIDRESGVVLHTLRSQDLSK